MGDIQFEIMMYIMLLNFLIFLYGVLILQMSNREREFIFYFLLVGIVSGSVFCSLINCFYGLGMEKLQEMFSGLVGVLVKNKQVCMRQGGNDGLVVVVWNLFGKDVIY